MQSSVDFLRELCAFPHRGSTTQEERKAASLIRGKLEEFGYKLIVQEFRATKDNFYLLPVQVLFLAIVAGLLSLFFQSFLAFPPPFSVWPRAPFSGGFRI